MVRSLFLALFALFICLHLCIVVADVEALQKTSPLYTAARAGDHPRVVELLQYQHVRSDVDVGKRSGGCAGRLGALGAPTHHGFWLHFACTVGIRRAVAGSSAASSIET